MPLDNYSGLTEIASAAPTDPDSNVSSYARFRSYIAGRVSSFDVTLSKYAQRTTVSIPIKFSDIPIDGPWSITSGQHRLIFTNHISSGMPKARLYGQIDWWVASANAFVVTSFWEVHFWTKKNSGDNSLWGGGWRGDRPANEGTRYWTTPLSGAPFFFEAPLYGFYVTLYSPFGTITFSSAVGPQTVMAVV